MKPRKSLIAVGVGLSVMVIMAALPSTSEAQARFFIRPRPVYGFYSPGWYYWPSRPVFVAAPVTGDVKIDTHLKDASVYIDGGYAGVTAKLKHFSLQPGNHDIEVRDSANRMLYRERVRVLLGKTVEIKLST
jgi:hypothetical protein